MTITIGFWAIPVAIVVVGYIIALIADEDFRNNSGGMLSGCLGAAIVTAALFLAAGVVLGKYLAEWMQ